MIMMYSWLNPMFKTDIDALLIQGDVQVCTQYVAIAPLFK